MAMVLSGASLAATIRSLPLSTMPEGVVFSVLMLGLLILVSRRQTCGLKLDLANTLFVFGS